MVASAYKFRSKKLFQRKSVSPGFLEVTFCGLGDETGYRIISKKLQFVLAGLK
jgi:hypothetical protein